MEVSIKNNLCRSFRGIGLRNHESRQLLNLIEKWYDSCGPQWTCDRIKDIRQWYESYLAGDPLPPSWHKHSNNNMPLGIWGYVFGIKNQAKALAVLSAATAFVSPELTPVQKDKFEKSLGAEPVHDAEWIDQIQPRKKLYPCPSLKAKMSPPGFEAIAGASVPVYDGYQDRKIHLNRSNFKLVSQYERARVNALCQSWQTVPMCTLELILNEQHTEQIPPGLLTDVNDYGDIFAVLPTQRENIVGMIGCIQEPELKCRWVANPNRVTQHYLHPLGEHWYNLLRSLETDCTFDQESGMVWVQENLKKGVSLSGADLTAATDLLDRRQCLRLISKLYFGKDLDNPKEWNDSYWNHLQHFVEVSNSPWIFTHNGEDRRVKWQRGQPLGSYPSFALLGLTNNALGEVACQIAGIPKNSFRVIGDDIIMDTKALGAYKMLVESIGGQVNDLKTLTSSRAAEFAGRVITPSRIMHKKVKYKEMSDNSFMSICSQLGEQSKSLLRPRQRKAFETFKYVPGVAIDGPWQKDSFGEPLYHRLAWYYDQVESDRVEPDKEQYDSWQFASKIYYTLAEQGKLGDWIYSIPYFLADDFQSQLASQVVHNNNPMLKNGKTALQALEGISSREEFQSYSTWIAHEGERLDAFASKMLSSKKKALPKEVDLMPR
jgi:hypothetical protein